MDVNFEDVLSKLNFSNPVSGEDLLQWILREVDPILFSNNIKDNMINPLLGQIKGLYEKIGKAADSITDGKIHVLAEPLRLNLLSKESSKERTKIRNSIEPIAGKLAVLYDKVGKEADSNIADRSKAMADPLGILDVRKEYKKKVKSVLSKAFSGLKPESVEKVSEKVSEEPEKRETKSSKKVSEESKNGKEGEKYSEQKSLVEKNGIDLSDDALASLTKIGNSAILGIVSGLGGVLEKVKSSKDSEGGNKNSKDPDWLGGLMGKIAGTLLLGGLAVTLVSAFWKDHIKPWLEEKIGFKLDFMDKFKGIFEGLAKWFTLGTLGSGGLALKIGGQIFETAGELGEKMIGGVFKAILGEGAEKGLSAGAVKLLSGATVKKIFGKALGGIGKAALKGIPIIGALISLGFAVDNFMNGNYIQGSLDLLNGAVGLIPGVGIPLSLGVSALQIFLEAKTMDLEGSEKNSAQAKILGSGLSSIMSGLWVVLRKAPIIEWFVGFGEGVNKLFTGDIKGGLNQLIDVPLIGGIVAPIVALWDNIEFDKNGNIAGFNFAGFYKEIKLKMLRNIISMIPSVFGIRYKVAEMMGIGGEFKQDEWNIDHADQAKANQMALEGAKGTNVEGSKEREENEVKRLEKLIDDTKKESKENDEGWTINIAGKYMKRSQLDDQLTYLNSQLEQNKKLIETEKNKSLKTINDGFIPSTFGNSYQEGLSVFDSMNNTEYSLAPEDNVLAFKSEGVFDKTLTDIKFGVVEMGKKLADLGKVLLENQSSTSNSMNVTNNSTSDKGSMVMSGKRDPIFDARADYWRKFPNERAFI